MNLNKKNLLIAVGISIAISLFVTFVIYANTTQYKTDSSQFLMSGIVEDALGPFVPFWLLGLIALCCFVVFTVLFYFIIEHIKNKSF